MTVRISDVNRSTPFRISAGVASELLLCSALAMPAQRTVVDFAYLGRQPMIAVNTAEQAGFSYIVDERTEDFAKFRRLKAEWKRERGARSTAAALAALPSYQKIMGIGKPALPFILSELKSEGDNPDHWFWALSVIAFDVNPVPAESRGNLSAMARAWLTWGEREGYV
jgi:hypothetical protein